MGLRCFLGFHDWSEEKHEEAKIRDMKLLEGDWEIDGVILGKENNDWKVEKLILKKSGIRRISYDRQHVYIYQDCKRCGKRDYKG